MSLATAITLSIAGSDSGGGAGIQADIKAISATGGYACTAVTALTAQNTLGVQGISAVPVEFVRAQIDSVFDDMAVRAIKIGMLSDAATIECVATALEQHQPEVVVLDPVMVASSGDLLLQPEAVDALKARLLPLADLLTPNLYEAQVLLDERHRELPADENAMAEMSQRLDGLGAKAVLLKGGHAAAEQSTDALCIDGQVQLFSGPRIDTRNTHGTGCSLSSAIASYSAQGYSLTAAVEQAKRYISAAIAAADLLDVGAGAGPVNHFFALHS
ncbi:MAG: bifunctional hydroxymethylpyrimidine kinase/phosphomethylpyrimidine kinase [Granulosicoccaceae bacterium]